MTKNELTHIGVVIMLAPAGGGSQERIQITDKKYMDAVMAQLRAGKDARFVENGSEVIVPFSSVLAAANMYERRETVVVPTEDAICGDGIASAIDFEFNPEYVRDTDIYTDGYGWVREAGDECVLIRGEFPICSDGNDGEVSWIRIGTDVYTCYEAFQAGLLKAEGTETEDSVKFTIEIPELGEEPAGGYVVPCDDTKYQAGQKVSAVITMTYKGNSVSHEYELPIYEG